MNKVQSRETEKQMYICALRQKAQELGRLPRKSDFDNADMAGMKALWGPWPRVLESAGLLPSKAQERLEKMQKRKERTMCRTEEADVENEL